MMVDPDAPSRGNPTCQSWLHWIVGNIKVCEIIVYQCKKSITLSISFCPPLDLCTLTWNLTSLEAPSFTTYCLEVAWIKP